MVWYPRRMPLPSLSMDSKSCVNSPQGSSEDPAGIQRATTRPVGDRVKQGKKGLGSQELYDKPRKTPCTSIFGVNQRDLDLKWLRLRFAVC